MLNNIKRRIASYVFPLHETEAEQAYNIWSRKYDNQPDNLMFDLDKILFSMLIENISFRDKVIVDIGCGTGRNWEKIYEKHPSRVIGYDVSEGMLKVLLEKFPQSEVHLLRDTGLDTLENESCDSIISTLAIAHIENIEAAFREWARVIKEGGHLIITDYHPDMLLKGGNRTFRHEGKLIAVKNYVHPLAKIRAIAGKLNLEMKEFGERAIDETLEHYYKKQQAIHIYRRFKGTPVIYGAHLIKQNAVK